MPIKTLAIQIWVFCPSVMAEDPRPGRGSSLQALADVQLAGLVRGELAVRRQVSQAELLERREELLGGPPFLVGSGLPDGHHVQAVVVRAGRPGEQAVDVRGRVVLGRDRAEILDGAALGGGDVYAPRADASPPLAAPSSPRMFGTCKLAVLAR